MSSVTPCVQVWWSVRNCGSALFGQPTWVERTAELLGLESSLNSSGRPGKTTPPLGKHEISLFEKEPWYVDFNVKNHRTVHGE